MGRSADGKQSIELGWPYCKILQCLIGFSASFNLETKIQEHHDNLHVIRFDQSRKDKSFQIDDSTTITCLVQKDKIRELIHSVQ